MRHLTTNTFFLTALLGLTAACDPGASGSSDGELGWETGDNWDDTDDTAEYRGQLADSGTQRARAAGSYELGAASMIQVWSISDDGSTELAGEGDVQADGSFSVQAEDASLSVLHALDASGDIIASAIVHEGELMSRIDVESTVEAWAFLERAEEEGDTMAANLADIQARVDAALAESVYADAEEGDGSAMASLTAALDAALEASVGSMQDSGFDGDAETLSALTASASQELSASLAAMGDSDDADAFADVYAAFFASVDAALEGAGMDAEDRYDAAAAGALAFDLMLSSAAEDGDEEVSGDGEQASGALLADAAAELVISAAGELDDASAQIVAEAAAELEAALETATSTEDAEQAWADFSAAVTAEVEVMLEQSGESSGDLGGLLEDLVIDVSAELEAAIDDLSTSIDEDAEDAEDAAWTSLDVMSELEVEIGLMLDGRVDDEAQLSAMSELMLAAAVGAMRS